MGTSYSATISRIDPARGISSDEWARFASIAARQRRL
jgi:hypothetical protein